MKRKTTMNPKEIFDLLQNKNSSYPSGLLINELGIILNQGADRDGAIEDYLVSLLSDESSNNRGIAFAHLSSVKEVADRQLKKLADFRLKPENLELISLIDEALGV